MPRPEPSRRADLSIWSSPIDLLARMQSKPPGLEVQDERDSPPTTIPQHENSTRQMIANEIEAERIRRLDAKRGPRSQVGARGSSSGGGGRSAVLMQAYAEISSLSAKKAGSSPSTGAHGGTDTPKGHSRGGRLAAAKKDFFGRPIVQRSVPPSTQPNAGAVVDVDARLARIALTTPEGDAVAGKIWYRYNEGFTNAIRRPLKIKDLFPSSTSRPPQAPA